MLSGQLRRIFAFQRGLFEPTCATLLPGNFRFVGVPLLFIKPDLVFECAQVSRTEKLFSETSLPPIWLLSLLLQKIERSERSYLRCDL